MSQTGPNGASVISKLMDLADRKGVLVRDAAKRKSWLKREGIENVTQDQIDVAETRLRKEIDKLIGPYIGPRKTKFDDLPEDLKAELGIVESVRPPSLTNHTTSLGVVSEPRRATQKTSAPVKKHKPPKKPRDRFGCFEGTASARINACITNKPKSVEQIAKESNADVSRVKGHVKWLIENEHAIQTNKGIFLVV